MKKLIFTILALCGLFVGLQAQITNTPNQKGVTTTGQLDTVRNTRVQDVPIQSNFVDQFGKTGQRPGLSPYGQRLNAIVKVTSSSIVSNSVAATTASIAVTVSDSGDYVLPVIERGVCYGLEENPTLLTATKVSDATISGKGFGNFNVIVSGLQPHTAYHARAYAVSMYDTVYGADLIFTTLIAGILSYAVSEVNKLSVDGAFTNPLSLEGDGTVTYARSAGDEICTVNATTGEVTLNGNAGTCTITATVTVPDNSPYFYATTTASYTLTVKTLEQIPLTFEAKEAGAVVTFTSTMTTVPTIQYSTNGGAWTDYTEPITLENVGDKVSFRGDNAAYATSTDNYSNFSCTDSCYIYGNIMSLVSSTDYADTTTLTADYAFYKLFYTNNRIVNHPSKTLVLPATTLTNNCYDGMFANCTSLTTAPALPATTLAHSCYTEMFLGCTSLTTAPVLPAETLTNRCYSGMFNGCSNLSSVTCLATDISASNCTHNWLSNVAGTGTLYKPAGMNSWTLDSPNGIPVGWTAIPVIPGKFTVNADGDQVYFSQGNLQATYNGTSWTWGFATNQWDYIGNAAGNTSINGNGTVNANNVTVDLFGWVGALNTTWSGELGTSGNAAMHGISNSYTYNDYGSGASDVLKSDWGNTIGMGWRTPSGGPGGEWEYMINTRSSGSTVNGTSNARYTLATINTDGTGVNGIILFPDGITIANSEATSWGTINDNSSWGTKCTSAQWNALEAKGCVFLPAAGYRYTATVTDGNGRYWSSTAAEDGSGNPGAPNAYGFSFGGNAPSTAGGGRIFGRSVRLVHTTKPMGSLSYPTTSMNKMTTDAAFTNPLTFVGDGTVTYSKSGDNNNICTVNAATGEVTLNGTAGTCTITATVTVPDNSPYFYTTTTASYTLTVVTLEQIPLTLEATTAGTIKVNSPRSGMQYSKNGGAKTTMTETTTINVAVGDKVQFFGNGTSITRYYKNSSDFTYIADGTAQVKAYGNIMSLVDETAYATATTLTGYDNFRHFFYQNSTITDASGLLLPATTLADQCYYEMFNNCTSLTTAPELPATTLANDCYYGMFKNCTSLTTAPALPATTLKNKCYYEMFRGCSNLNSVTCLATNISASNCTNNWLYGVAATGIIATPKSTSWGSGASGIPNGWTRVENMLLSTPLTFEAKTAEAKVTFNIASGVTGLVEYSTNGSTWNSYTSGTEITLTNVGDKVSFRGNNAAYASSSSNYSTFTCSNDCYIYGNVMSLVNVTEFADVKTLASNYAFCRLFYQNTHIVNHPSKTLILPATSIATNCYQEMFYGCTNLTKAPELPATTLATNCYSNMFYGCTNLTKAPVLPAATLANGCYRSMFAGCTSLTVAPALLATTLTTDCYYSMFDSCTSLTTAPTLPAKTTVQDCYTYMFRNCSNLNSVRCSATPNSSNTHNWLYNAATSGTFYKASTESWSSDASGIPSGWTVVNAVIDLSTVTSDTILPNGWTVTGTLAGNYKISIAHGAIVTLHNVDINGSGSLNGSFAGITCNGDATIILSGTNTVRGFSTDYPGIQPGRYSSEPNPATLTIQGTGSLTATGGNYSAGIGSGNSIRCGNIIINGGTITATGGQRGAGIGSSFNNSYCGNITINGGTIVTMGGNEGCAGIGSGNGNSHCGNITISGGTVTATGSSSGAGIGSGYSNSKCGDITISGGTVTAMGGSIGAGIGTATDNSYCGDITITNTVTRVTATKGDNATNSIGRGGAGSIGTVTIGGNVGAISTSPYTYEP